MTGRAMPKLGIRLGKGGGVSTGAVSRSEERLEILAKYVKYVEAGD